MSAFFLRNEEDGPPREIRTPDTQVRSLVLYPAELWADKRREVYGLYPGIAMFAAAPGPSGKPRNSQIIISNVPEISIQME